MFRNGVTAIATAMINASAPQAGRPVARPESQSPTSAVPPVSCSDSLTGISAPSITTIGQSTAS